MNYEVEYQTYLAVCQKHLGPLNPGQYGMFGRSLVKKLGPDEFVERYEDFLGLANVFKSSMKSGATVDDTLYQELKTAAIALLMREERDTFCW